MWGFFLPHKLHLYGTNSAGSATLPTQFLCSGGMQFGIAIQ
jgi:hypothetical protein